MTRRPISRTLRSVAITLVAALGIAYALWPSPVEVDLGTVVRGDMFVTVDEDGKTRIKERYVVSAPLEGRLLRVELHSGDPVEAGRTVIATIEPTEPELLDPRARAQAEARVRATEAAVKRALALRDQARPGYQLAETEYGRINRLFRRRSASAQEYEAAEHELIRSREALRAAEFALLVAEFEHEMARAALLRTKPAATDSLDLERFEIRAPITGRVLRVLQESDRVVTRGTPLLELGDPTDLEVEIDVLSSDGVKVHAGAKVLLEHWGGDAPLPARVRLVEPSGFTKISALGVEEQRVNVIADFVDPVEERARVGDGFRVDARIVVWEGSGLLKVPAGALFRHGEDWAVFSADSNRARLRLVRIGHANAFEAEVLDGLAENSRVILHPSDQVANGVRIRLR